MMHCGCSDPFFFFLHREEDGVHISAVNMFSVSADVTSAEVYNSIQMSLSNCSSSLAHCRVVLQHKMTYHSQCHHLLF